MRSLLPLTVALASCYSPEALDCTVACSAANECADGQVCGSDGFCASPSAAGHCGGPDGGMPSQLVTLRVSLSGPGKVTIDSVGVCDSDMAEDDICMFSVRSGTPLSLKASANGDHEFREWTGACNGAPQTCSLPPVTAMTQVGAKFE